MWADLTAASGSAAAVKTVRQVDVLLKLICYCKTVAAISDSNVAGGGGPCKFVGGHVWTGRH